ncbi:hypothetical protein [Streptomyces sp. cmx-4-7]|uniref:hypothetical protein n=1 Tax=Streptomyces sp. cmx-4-7 TaxID=2790939 RepID=UPI00397F6084
MSPRGTRARRANGKKRAIWLAAGVVLLGGTGVTAVAAPAEGGGVGPGDGARPANAHVLTLDGKDPRKRALPRTGTRTFSLVGVSWEDAGDTFEGIAQIRTREAATGEWSAWRDLDFGIRPPESTEGGTSDVRGASEPLWVGPSNGIEARIVADGEETAVPDALRLDMIDPGETAKGDGTTRVLAAAPAGLGERPIGVVPSPKVTDCPPSAPPRVRSRPSARVPTGRRKAFAADADRSPRGAGTPVGEGRTGRVRISPENSGRGRFPQRAEVRGRLRPLPFPLPGDHPAPRERLSAACSRPVVRGAIPDRVAVRVSLPTALRT